MSIVADVPLEDVIKQRYLDYSCSVIMSRAIPDARDGLLPVHRRILYTMHDDGNTPSKAYRKSAKTVGSVMGNLHPHGDGAIYGALVRMAQPFSMLQPLIDGQGNFGSIDGDPPAAMRYTEARLTAVTDGFFPDLEKETVRFDPNYDGQSTEPTVLPVSFPNLLVNGVTGIAVGMATNVLPHNLDDVIAATKALMADEMLPTSEVAAILRGPDFPTGGLVHSIGGFVEAVECGRGRVFVRSKWHEEREARGATSVVITELPYQVNKKKLIDSIVALVREKKIDGITEISDQTNKDGVRLVIRLARGENAEVAFSTLAHRTDVEIAASYNCTVIADGRPRSAGLRELIEIWISFRRDVVMRRTMFEKRQAEARAHLLDGYLAAVAQIDAVVRAIRTSDDPAAARDALVALLAIDEGQADAVLALSLRRLTGLETGKIATERGDVGRLIARLGEVVGSPSLIDGIITAELDAVAARHGAPRRSEVSGEIMSVTREDMIAREEIIITMTRGGYIKRMPAETFKTANRGVVGKASVKTSGDDLIRFVASAHSHDTIAVVTKSGILFPVKAYKVPEGRSDGRGRHITNVIERLKEEAAFVMTVPAEDPTASVVFVTARGTVKRLGAENLPAGNRTTGKRALMLEGDDEIVSAFVAGPSDHVMIVSSSRRANRFPIEDVRPTGNTAYGVIGIRLEPGERVIGALPVRGGGDDGLFLLSIGERGIGKRTPVSDFAPHGRGARGILAFAEAEKTGNLAVAMGVREGEDVIITTRGGVTSRIRVSDVSTRSRITSGVILMDVKRDTVLSATVTPGEPDADVAQEG